MVKEAIPADRPYAQRVLSQINPKFEDLLEKLKTCNDVASLNGIPSESNATLLLAGSSSGDIPVIYATGRNFERLSLVPANWAPFGLTEKALSLEGEVKVLAPPKMMPKRHTIKKKRH